ncbi:MAG: 50S ribosomal protein L2 [Candidatus Woesearchaeota archaeon]
MGKNLIQQRRGKGSLRFKAPKHRFVGRAEYPKLGLELKGIIKEIIHCPAHTSPLIRVKYSNGESVMMIAHENARVGDEVLIGENVSISNGNVLPLEKISEGTSIFNIEANPGDGGKFVRSGGNSAKIIAKSDSSVSVLLPSKKVKEFNPKCRATIGKIAGSGRLEKPLLKAGVAYFKAKARNRYWPNVCGQSMNAVAHPHGGKRSSKKNYSLIVPRSAPPGAKVGKISPRRTGRKR